MRTNRLLVTAAAWVAAAGSTPLYGETLMATGFSYQGQLKENGTSIDGTVGLRFRLYDAATGSGQIGSQVELAPVTVVDGLFTVPLDFGASVFMGQARWLEVTVESPAGQGNWTTLSPRQRLTGTPYAMHTRGLYCTETGNVGIGTATPEGKLDVSDPTPGGLVASGVSTDDAGGGMVAYSSTFPPPFDHFADRLSLLSNAFTATGLDLRADGATSDMRFYTGGFGTANERMRITASGQVGIGTTSPDTLFEVESTTGSQGIRSTTSAIPIAAYRSSSTGTWPAIHAENSSGSSNTSAIRGIITDTTPGGGAVAVKGINHGTTSAGIGVEGSQDGSGWGVYGHTPSGRGVYGSSESGTGVYGRSTTGYAGFFDGRVAVDVVEIRGADVAERFPVSEAVAPGMVVAIDPRHPGQLCLARGVYNRCVAGIVSGANNLAAGAVLGSSAEAQGAPPIALSGRVWVQCDATGAPIQPGDLLTTADMPGHAMKVLDFERAQGAVLGKAMTALDQGRGLVLVLVSLQ